VHLGARSDHSHGVAIQIGRSRRSGEPDRPKKKRIPQMRLHHPCAKIPDFPLRQSLASAIPLRGNEKISESPFRVRKTKTYCSHHSAIYQSWKSVWPCHCPRFAHLVLLRGGLLRTSPSGEKSRLINWNQRKKSSKIPQLTGVGCCKMTSQAHGDDSAWYSHLWKNCPDPNPVKA